jgi:hypothetical protein
MKFDVYLSSRAKKQYKRFDAHIRHKLRTELLELEEDPSEKGSLSLSHSFLRPGGAIEPVSGYALLMFYLTLDPIKDII